MKWPLLVVAVLFAAAPLFAQNDGGDEFRRKFFKQLEEHQPGRDGDRHGDEHPGEPGAEGEPGGETPIQTLEKVTDLMMKAEEALARGASGEAVDIQKGIGLPEDPKTPPEGAGKPQDKPQSLEDALRKADKDQTDSIDLLNALIEKAKNSG